MRFLTTAVFSILGAAACQAVAQDGAKLYLKGSGWFQFGRVMHSSDTLNPLYDYNDNWQQSSGAQFTVVADIDEHMQGAMGLGGFQFHTPQGTSTTSFQAALGFAPFITEARFTYFMESRENPPVVLDVGFFPYQYNVVNRNFGSYLLRGPVYPGILFSEFESKSLDPTVANILGFRARHNLGGMFSHDLLLRSEIEFPPVFDVSLLYLATLRLGEAIELGGGVNFYRLLATQAEATSPAKNGEFRITDPSTVVGEGETPHPYMGDYAYIDPVSGDTTMLSHRGVKVMGRVALDLKPFLSPDGWGAMDLKLFAEAAVIGVKDYKGVYPDIKRRIPVTFGLGLPTFGLLDESVIEAEWYGAPFRDDYRRLMTEASPVPMSNKNYTPNREAGKEGDVHDMRKDDWKWSFNASKTFQRSIRLSFQAANDHFRPINHVNSNPTQVERLESAFTTMKDWYLMFKVGFNFQ